jgi:hypothetical protein
MCTFIARSLMNDVEVVRNAPCTFCSIRILDIGKCKRRCPSPFVTLVMMEGIALILFLNLGMRFRLRGVGCDAPGFYLTLMVGQNCWQWSNHGQPGSSPQKPHRPTLMTHLSKSTHTCGQTFVKDTVKPHLNPDVFECPPELLLHSPNFT